MLAPLFRNWWAFALRGLFTVIFGVLAFLWPQQTVFTLALLFGAFALVDGIFTLSTGFVSMGSYDRLWVGLLGGVAGCLLSLMALLWAVKSAFVVVYLIAAWVVVTGLLEIVSATQLRRVITGEWILTLCGILSILLGGLLFGFPGTGAVNLVSVIGLYAIVLGIMLISLAFRLRSLLRKVKTTSAAGD